MTVRLKCCGLDPRSLNQHELDLLISQCDAEKIKRGERFVFEDDRRAFFVSHGLLRLALSSSCPSVLPTQWTFDKERRGKPIVLKPMHFRHMQFNISHCRTRILCAWNDSLPCGVDVECTTGCNISLGMLQSCLTDAEFAWVTANKSYQHQRQSFMFAWTMKEA